MAKSLKLIPCPGCAELGLQRIVYGMPDEDFEFDKYIMGGCVMADFDIGCKKCGWSGIRKELEVQ
jgi:hypothetical protein